MKKYIFLITVFGLISSMSLAQYHKASSASAGAFQDGDNLVTAGIGVGSPFFGSGYSSSFPVNPTVSYEHGVSNAISVGGTVSYASSKYNYGGFSLKESAIYIGAKGSYHFGSIIELPRNVDVYAGLSLGYIATSVSDNTGDAAATGSGVGYGIYVGGKYYFSPSFGVYAELGYQSLSYLNVGVSFKI